jgi:hypothetical protein
LQTSFYPERLPHRQPFDGGSGNGPKAAMTGKIKARAFVFEAVWHPKI